ncbi:MAG TPA: GntR family transcriptional regulator [Steroidobacteraceae bacterium]|jgi:GntR family transcriptional regulator|nr:GntR family transcriptional regulator [Steroidobacteraceae bacterium]
MDADLLHVQPSAPEPIYRQIVEQLRRLIASGKLLPGVELPSVREIAGRHAINPMTVSRAYSLLEYEGLLERQRGKGMIVAATRRRPQSDDSRLELLQPRLQEVARQARELGLPDRRVLERLQALLEEHDERIAHAVYKPR